MYVFDAPNSDYNYILFPFVQGVLPLDYLDATEEFKAHSILTNAKEIMAQFEVTFLYTLHILTYVLMKQKTLKTLVNAG